MHALENKFKSMPSFEIFYENFTKEQSKFMHLCALPSSKNEALVAHTSKGRKNISINRRNILLKMEKLPPNFSRKQILLLQLPSLLSLPPRQGRRS